MFSQSSKILPNYKEDIRTNAAIQFLAKYNFNDFWLE